MVRAAGPTVVFRSRWSVALAVAMLATAVVGVVLAASAGAEPLRVFGAPLLLFGLLGWAAFWHPHVEVSDGGVRVANTWRTMHVPWPSITEVDGRYGLRLRTAYGTVTSWAAPAPSGRARARSQGSEAAQVVGARLEELRAAGYLDHPVLEREALETTWDVPLLAAAGLLLLVSIVLPALG
jgi:hypothetical protein